MRWLSGFAAVALTAVPAGVYGEFIGHLALAPPQDAVANGGDIAFLIAAVLLATAAATWLAWRWGLHARATVAVLSAGAGAVMGVWACLALIVAGASGDPNDAGTATFWTGMGMGVLTIASRRRRSPSTGAFAQPAPAQHTRAARTATVAFPATRVTIPPSRTASGAQVHTTTAMPTTTNPHHDAVVGIAEAAARQIAPALLVRLRSRYGQDWKLAVNRNRRSPDRQQTLRDYRFCLSVLANDPSTRRWASRRCRDAARDLSRLANDAVHRNPLTAHDIDVAQFLADTIAEELRHKPTALA